MFARRVDDLARRLASDELIARTGREPAAPTVDSAFDGLARALAAPLSRRRMLAAAGGAVAAASLLRPGRAQADCFPGGPKICSNPHGARVCVPSNLACCSNDNCAIACPYPWRDCAAPAVCNDTSRMCHDPSSNFTKEQTQFCHQTVKVVNGCVDAGYSMAVRGWCCRPRERCSTTTFGECICDTCGSDCCRPDEECVRTGLPIIGEQKCLRKCPPGWHHDGFDCVCDSGQTCGTRCCPAGSDCVGSSCRKPPPAPSDPDLLDRFKGYFQGIGDTAASRGGGSARDARAAAVSPVSGALLALGAVSTQGQVAALALGDHHRDSAYRTKVRAPRPSPPKIASGPGLPATAAAALQAVVTAEATGYAQLLACATALARARGALRHHNVSAARTQSRAAARFADNASRRLKRVPALRIAAAVALRTAGVAEVTVTLGQTSQLHDDVILHGIPSDLRAALQRLGVRGGDFGRARTALLGTPSSGPVLIAPLMDSGRNQNLTALASSFSAFARAPRRQPILSTRPGRRRYRPH
jgi:hypothetical protein